MHLHPLSLYIHIPWCVKKCPYCDFNSYASPAELPEQEYIQVLLQDLAQDLPRVSGRTLKSIFFGGGTPSLFSPKSFEILLNHIHSVLPCAPNMEITLEANPGTLEHKSFKDYRATGINRISIGAQSFNNDALQTLGRIHSADNIYKAIDSIRQGGFDNFNIDIMYGLPHQSLEDALFDLKAAIQRSPTHLSWYHLTIEPNTIFHHKPPLLPTDDDVFEMQQAGFELLAQHGFTQYEVSAFAQKGFQCQHNKHYWEFGDYLGIGAGAHGKITTPTQEVCRLWKIRYPKSYLTPNTCLLGGKKILTEKELSFEFMLNALRLIEGFPISLFQARTGLDIANLEPGLSQAIAKQLLTMDNTRIKPTTLGNRFLNDLMSLFL